MTKSGAALLLARRVLSALYDLLLTVALILVAASPLPLLPASFTTSTAGRTIIFTAAIAIWVFYFGYCWINGGQTIGMRAWRLTLRKDDNESVFGWRKAILRFLVAIVAWGLGCIGILWLFFDNRQRTWPDLATATYFEFIPKHRVPADRGK